LFHQGLTARSCTVQAHVFRLISPGSRPTKNPASLQRRGHDLIPAVPPCLGAQTTVVASRASTLGGLAPATPARPTDDAIVAFSRAARRRVPDPAYAGLTPSAGSLRAGAGSVLLLVNAYEYWIVGN